MKSRLTQLNAALLTTARTDPEYDAASAIVARAGGAVKGWAETRKLSLLLPDLLKHVTWKEETRNYLKKREANLLSHESLW